MRVVLVAAVVVVLGVATLGLVFLLGMRAKSPPVVDAVRRTNRRVFNPVQLRSAGQPGAYASVVRHVGRTSGRPYATPVGAVQTDDGFVIALPYGTRADWVRNVLAAGSATIVHEGRTYDVVGPRVVATSEVLRFFPESDRRGFRVLHIDDTLQVRLAHAPVSS
jgi:deazaflavin-dependent oxidoreductase (nitroreductase family)